MATIKVGHLRFVELRMQRFAFRHDGPRFGGEEPATAQPLQKGERGIGGPDRRAGEQQDAIARGAHQKAIVHCAFFAFQCVFRAELRELIERAQNDARPSACFSLCAPRTSHR